MGVKFQNTTFVNNFLLINDTNTRNFTHLVSGMEISKLSKVWQKTINPVKSYTTFLIFSVF